MPHKNVCYDYGFYGYCSKVDTILNHAITKAFLQKGKIGILTASASILLFAGVAAFGTVSSPVTYSGEIHEVVEQLASLLPEQIASDRHVQIREIRIQQDDTLDSLLARMGIRDDKAFDFLHSNPQTEAMFRQLAPGKTLTAEVSFNGVLHRLIFPLNGNKDSALFIEKTPDGFQAESRNFEFEPRISLQSAVIRYSLFGAADDAGIPESVAMQLADIFGGDIDFHRDLRKGDRFSVIYETMTYLGKPIRSQRILAAEFVNDGKTHQAFWYPTNGTDGGYYTRDGHSIKKAFLRSPLEFSRITSGFSNARYHPVLNEIRAHKGIDYGAPTGTKVKATGDGVIEFSGIQGGYGKSVRIRHPGDRVTVYGHLSGFASGITNGKRVSQGEVIGFVGATGLATGPHLHYEFRVAGVHRNPLAIALPTAAPLHPSQINTFKAHISDLEGQISAIRHMQLVSLD